MSSADLFSDSPAPTPPGPVIPVPAPSKMTAEPAPVAPAVKSTTSPLVWVLGAVIAVVVLGQSILLFLMFERQQTPGPTPISPIPAAMKAYQKSLPDAFHQVELGITGGTLKTKADVVTALQAHSMPLASVLESATSPFFDTNGNLTNAAGAAKVFHDAYVALGGK